MGTKDESRFLDTLWSLPLMIINKYDDVIFLYALWNTKKAGGGKEMDEEKVKETASYLLCVFFSYSTDTEIKTVVKHWYDVDMTAYMPFSGLFLQRITCL